MRVKQLTHLNFCRVSLKRLLQSGMALAVLSLSTASLAGDVDEFGPVRPDRPGNKASEQTLAFEIRFGPYLPLLPNQTASVPSFGQELGQSHRVMLGFEADWQMFRLPEIFSLGPGAGLGYTKLGNSANDSFGNLQYSASLKSSPSG